MNAFNCSRWLYPAISFRPLVWWNHFCGRQHPSFCGSVAVRHVGSASLRVELPLLTVATSVANPEMNTVAQRHLGQVQSPLGGIQPAAAILEKLRISSSRGPFRFATTSGRHVRTIVSASCSQSAANCWSREAFAAFREGGQIVCRLGLNFGHP